MGSRGLQSNDPVAWNLEVADSDIDVVIRSALTTADRVEPQQQNRFEPVSIEGSHYGFGFVSLGDK